jgi:hypothetical protein
MIGIEVPRGPKAHSLDMLHISFASRAVVWLQVVLLSPPLLAPCPLDPGGGPAWSPELKPAHCVDEVKFIESVDIDLLPLVMGEIVVHIHVPHDERFAARWALL